MQELGVMQDRFSRCSYLRRFNCAGLGAGRKPCFHFGGNRIGSGFLAVPILTGCCAYAIAEAFDWKASLDKKPRRAKGFYAVIAGCTLIGALVNFAGINPIRALFWTAVINGVLAPPLLVIIMVISNNEKIVGDRRNSILINLLGWLTAAIMFAAALGLILTWNY